MPRKGVSGPGPTRCHHPRLRGHGLATPPTSGHLELGASQRNPYDVRGRQARAPWVFTGVRPVQGPHQILRSQLSRVPAMETSQGQAGPPPATRKGVPCRAVPPDGDGQTRLARGLVRLCGHLALAAVPTVFPWTTTHAPRVRSQDSVSSRQAETPPPCRAPGRSGQVTAGAPSEDADVPGAPRSAGGAILPG